MRRASIASIVIGVLLAAASARAQELCKEGTGCTGAGRGCIEGTCRTTCTSDAGCAGGQCVAGGCFPSFNIDYPFDYGLADGDLQPGCDSWRGNIDCMPELRCQAGVCQMLDGGGNARGCMDTNQNFNGFCPPFGGYACSSGGVCQGPTCGTVADCVAAYPIASLTCREGRCTSSCTAASDCCAAPARCDSRAQDECYSSPGNPAGGMCVRETAMGRLIPVWLANPDPHQVKNNIIFVVEGITDLDGGDIGGFETHGLRHIRWLLTHADMFNALLRNDHNLYLLELRDRHQGLGEGTIFGRFEGALNVGQDRPGADEQSTFQAQNALAQYAGLSGFSQTFTGMPIKVVILYNSDGDFRATGGSRILQPFDADSVPGINAHPNVVRDDYFVMQHEFGHFMGFIVDEYDSDSGARTPGSLPDPRWCTRNVAARSAITGCTVCEGGDDVSWDQTGAYWSPFINTTTFPTGGNDVKVVGFYEGGLRFWTRAALRSQHDCVMRQDGRETVCPACREELLNWVIGDRNVGFARFLDIDGNILQPIPAGDGPHRAMAVSNNLNMGRVFMTREAVGGPTLSFVDTNLLTHEGTTNVGLTTILAGAGTPRSMAIDELNDRIFMEGINSATPADSRLVVYAVGSNMLSSVSVPSLAGQPMVEPSVGPSGEVITYRETASTRQIVRVNLAGSPLTASFSSPTGNPAGIPRFFRAPLAAPTAGLDFFLADKLVPSDGFCDFSQCQIWTYDPQTGNFRDAAVLNLTTTGVVDPGVIVATVAREPDTAAAITGELLIAVTGNQVYVWRTANVNAGTTTPAAVWSHNMGVAAAVSAVAYNAATEQVIIGNKAGEVKLFAAADGAPGPAGEALPAIPGFATGMQVRGIQVSPDGATYVALGGFFPAARAGVIAAFDLSGSAAGDARLVFAQPVASVGLGGPVLVIDENRGMIYSNAVVDSGDGIGPSGTVYRSPVIRAFHEIRYAPTGCP